MDVIELKQYIIDNDKIQDVLVLLGCHNIREYSNEIRCAFPDGDNNTAIRIYKDSLIVTTYTHKQTKGDIITLIQDIKQFDFLTTLKWLHQILGIQWAQCKKPKKNIPKFDPLSIFTSKLKSKMKCNVDDVIVYDESVIEEYCDCIHIDWVREGITEKIRKEFHLGFDFKKNRIIIPWKAPYSDGYVGIVGRTVNEMYKELGIPKYWNYITGFQKSKALYGFQENYKYIQQQGYCVVYESEKSVLKRASLGDRTGLALGSHTISDEQIKLILSLNVDVIIALDNDIDTYEVRSNCEKFWLYRNTYYIKDKWNIMGEKDAPADMKNKQFNFLLKYKIKYDDTEHNKYLKDKEK